MAGGRLVKMTRRRLPYRRYPKRRRYATRIQRMHLPPLGIPTRKFVRLRYSDQVQLTPGAGVVGTQVVRCNGGFDPDQSGVGHQPRGWDQWTTWYNHYVVLGAKIRADFLVNTSQSGTATVGVMLNDNATYGGGTSILDFRESRLSSWKHFQLGSGAGNLKTTIIKKFSTKKFFGVKDVKDNIDRLGSTVGSNPSEDANFICFIGNNDGVGNISGVTLVYTVEYLVMLSEPKDIAQS